MGRTSFQSALVALNERNLSECERLFKMVLKDQPEHVAALNLLAVVLMNMEKFAEAREFISRAIRQNSKSDVSFYNYGVILKRLNKPKEALVQFNNSLSLNARVPETWNNRGTIYNDLHQYESAISDFNRAILLNSNYAEAFCNRGNALTRLKRFDEAFTAYDKAVALKPDLAEAWLGRGNVFTELKRYDEAFAAYDKALVLKPDSAEAWLCRSNVFTELKRYDEAFTAYDKALALKPDLADAWLGRGNVFTQLKRYDEAVAAYDKALVLKPELAEVWLRRGNVFTELEHYDEAFVAYDTALALEPELAEAWFCRGNVFTKLKRYDEAVTAYDKALAFKPELAEAWLGSGNVFTELKLYNEALTAYDKALAPKPDLAEAWVGRGNVFTELKRYDEAVITYDKALALKPELDGAEGSRLYAKMHLCDWSNFAGECSHLVSSLKNNGPVTTPFHFLAFSTSPEDQFICAHLWVTKRFPRSDNPIWRGEIYKHDKIRLAYVSADFHQHATSSLAAGMFERHDKSRFEVTAISIGPDDASETRQRVKDAFEHFIDFKGAGDDRIASELYKGEIDILVDLKGFTQGARTGIFARRCAPIQVSYLGYPGTMGAPYIDYLIADKTLIPEECQTYYSEKLVYLPNSYQVNDEKRLISDKRFSRAEVGLPDHGFVFCCFNNDYKITPSVFHRWMKILKRVEGSILWLFEGSAIVPWNLRKEATASGVDPERLVFAKGMLAPDHLARQRLADLFLDTLPCNAHTTASDALWAGLPVLTQVGETFAGRVAASLLNAIGLPELITSTPQAYEHLAIELATNPAKLARIKQKLADNRLTTPLFDTCLITKHIEAAYTTMYERYQAGLSPDHIHVPF